jgi:hypothetical protein
VRAPVACRVDEKPGFRLWSEPFECGSPSFGTLLAHICYPGARKLRLIDSNNLFVLGKL